MRLIQSSGKKQVDAAGSATQNFTFATNVLPGSDAYITLTHYGNGTTTERISSITVAGTAATKIVEKRDAISQNQTEIWQARNVTGATNTIVVVTGGVNPTGHYFSFSVEEWRGTAASDRTGTGGPTGSSTAPAVTAGGATAQADELIYASFADYTGTNWTSATPPSGYTEAWEEPNGTAHEAGSGAYNRLTAISTPTATFTTGSAMTWISALATFLAYGPNHSLNYHFVSAGGSTLTTPAMTFSTAATGSTMLAFVARGVNTDHASNSVSDNKTNTFTRQTVNGSTSKTYTDWPTSGTALYACTNFTGGAGHTVTVAKPDVNDEVTLLVVEAPGTVIQDMQWTQNSSGPTSVSATVTYTNDAWLLCAWFGDDSNGELNPAVSAGWQKLEWTNSLASNHVQCALAVKHVTGSGTDACTWTPSTSQGAQTYIVAIQASGGGGSPSIAAISNYLRMMRNA